MKQRKAEQHALERVLYLLEENSFKHLSARDDRFASIVEDVYRSVDRYAQKLVIAHS